LLEHDSSFNQELIKLVQIITGKRYCIGESLARNCHYLFVAALVKTFQFTKVPGQPLPTLNPVNGFTLGYDGFLAVAMRR
jgi:methyl farnesoate epoxidase / farnesoate epoxidase